MFLKVRHRLPRIFRCMSNESSEVKEIAAVIVRDYLNGHWKAANSNNIIVQKISGGLSNWLYKITLPLFQNQNEGSDPKTVLLRLYGPNYGKSAFERIVTDSLIFMLMSERQLGPKLHGVFQGGRIEEYIPARSLKCCELRSPKISSEIASKIAEIHTLNVPISKTPDSLYDLMSQWMTVLTKDWEQYKVKDPYQQKLMEEFKKYDLLGEIQWLWEYLKKSNSPVVFCHNDLQEGNILITYDSINSDKPKLIFIDFEYCSYNYRGFDFANHFIEYTINYKEREYPYFKVDNSAYPSLEEQVNFIRSYLKVYKEFCKSQSCENGFVCGNGEIDNFDEVGDIYRNLDVTNEEKHLLREISHFRLLSHLFWGIWSATHSQSGFEFGYWDYCLARINAYFEIKDEILVQKMPKVRRVT